MDGTTQDISSVMRPEILHNESLKIPLQYNYLFKVSLIGDSGTGKTSILLRFSDNVFQTETQSTIGVDFKIVSMAIEKLIVKLQIWDTCGSERFNALTASFIKSCSVFILVFDLTKEKSFDRLNYWLNLIGESTSPKLICIVGNKADLQNERKIDFNRIKMFSERNNLKYIETSAKDNKNIEDVFIYIIETLLEDKIKTKDNISSNNENTCSINNISNNRFRDIKTLVEKKKHKNKIINSLCKC